tara:strand:- start:1927 stop:2295 length:369 start_codon:yes stop_codon:yes gene_type:complete
MAAGIYNFTIEQGTTFTREFKYKNSEGVAVPLTTYAVRMQIRKTIGSSSPELSLTETATDGGSILAVGSGDNSNVITLTISAADTAAMTFDTAVYDLEIELLGVVTRLLQGKIKLSKEVTRD